MPLTTRAGKGSALTHGEMDANFTGLADGSLITGNLSEYAAVNPTAAGLSILDDADVAAIRTTLGFRYDGESTWAARGSGSVTNAIKLITDIGDGGTYMRWNGTYWRVIAPTDIIFLTTSTNGTTSGADQVVLSSGSFPAGLLRAGRTIDIKTTFGKSGTTDAATASRVRIGTADTTADAVLWTLPAMAAGSRSAACQMQVFLTSATNMRVLASQNKASGVGIWPSAVSTSSYPSDVTIADVDANALFIHVDHDLTGTTDTPQVFALIITLLP